MHIMQGLTQWINEISTYEPILVFDWDRMLTILEKEPLAILAVSFAFINVMLTVLFKMSDYWRDVRNDKSRRGRLHIELHPMLERLPNESPPNQTGEQAILQAVLTNAGKEPIVIRAIGYLAKPSWFAGISRLPQLFSSEDKQFLRFDNASVLDAKHNTPITLQAHEFVECRLVGAALEKLMTHRFAVKDSLGNIWPYPAQNRRWRRVLHRLQHNAATHATPTQSQLV